MKECLLNQDFHFLVESILNGSNTWIKSKRAFILTGCDDLKYDSFTIHVPFKTSFEDFKLSGLIIEFPLTMEQKKILLKAFLCVSNIIPKFMTIELLSELDSINLIPYSPNNDLKDIARLKNNKIKSKKETYNFMNIKYEDFEDIFSSHLKIPLGEKLGLEDYVSTLEEVQYTTSQEFNHRPFFALKSIMQKKAEKKITHSLVLWDIENVNFIDDFSIITNKVKKDNQLKIVSFYKKNKADRNIFYLGNIQFKLNKLKKRDWIVKTSKDNADTELMENYFKYKNSIKELILITSDRDFKPIIEDAINSNIEVKILNNSHYENNSWFESFNYENINTICLK